MKKNNQETGFPIELLKSFKDTFNSIMDKGCSIDIFESSIKLDGDIALMCPHCYNIILRRVYYKSNLFIEQDIPNEDNDIHNPELWFIPTFNYVAAQCSFCGAGDVELIELDPNIAAAISLFNKKGFKTKACCEGHGKEEGYIFFENDDLLHYTNTIPLPLSWAVDWPSYRDKIGFIIRADARGYRQSLLDIWDYANNLPYINGK